LTVDSGLDNAGKTTIVKKIMNEDVNTVSPTLGFIIKTIDFQGLVDQVENPPELTVSPQLQAQHLGRGRTENNQVILEKLFREDGRVDLGRRRDRQATNQ
jgi:hypothetical protein